MAERNDLQIVIEAVNKASKDLKQIEKDLKSLSEGAEGTGKATQAMGVDTVLATVGFKGLASAVATGTLGAYAAKEAFEFVTGAVSDMAGAIKDATIYASGINALGIGMEVVAANAGITSQEVYKLRDSVRDQNITTEAANELMIQVIQNELDYTKVTELASAAQNRAAAFRISSSEALERITYAISSGYPYLLKQLGMTKHQNEIYEEYAATLGLTGDQLDETQRKQAVFNYVIEDSAKFTGVYGQAMENAYKKMMSTKDMVKEMAYNLGQVFEPALKEVVVVAYDAVKGIVDWARENEDKLRLVAKALGETMLEFIKSIRDFFDRNKGLLIDIVNFTVRAASIIEYHINMLVNQFRMGATGIELLANTVIQSAKVMVNAMTGNYKGVIEAGQEWLTQTRETQQKFKNNLERMLNSARSLQAGYSFDLREWWAGVQGIEKEALDLRESSYDAAGKRLTAKEIERLKKLQEENEKYAKAIAEKAKAFEESLEDLIISHRDTWKSIKKDIDEEKENFKKSLEDKKKEHEKALSKMAEDHNKKTQSMLDDIEDEKRAAREEIEDIEGEWNELINLTKNAGEDRLANLQAQLDKELALGESADKDKVASLLEMIAKEKLELEKAVNKQKGDRDKEVKDVEDTLNEKLTKLQEELSEEEKAYQESIEEKRLAYEEDLQNFRDTHDKKLSELEEKLQEEETLREMYAEDFKRIGDKQAEDDITRLKRKHEEEMEELKSDHLAKVAEIEGLGYEMGKSFNRSFGEGFDNSWAGIEARVSKFKEAWLEIQRITAPFGGPFYSEAMNEYWRLLGGTLQHGGVAAKPSIVGEKGYPEVVLPLSEPSRIETILRSLGMGKQARGQVVQNFNITVTKESDVDLIMERAAFNMRHRL